MVRGPLSAGFQALFAGAALAACVGYSPRPIVPERSAAEFRARRLDAPEIAQFASQVLPPGSAFPPANWDLVALTLVALHEHPSLAAARAHFDTVHAAVESASEHPNPTLSVDSEYTDNTSVLPWALGFTVDFPIETGGKRAARVALAERESDLARLDLVGAAWAVRSGVRTALVALLAAEREGTLLDAELALASRRSQISARRVEAGEDDRASALASSVVVARTQRERASAARRVGEAHSALARAMGIPESALDGVSVAWPGFAEPRRDLATAVAPDTGLQQRLDLRRALAEYAQREARLELEVALQYPDVAIGPGFQWDRGDHKWRLAASIPLPIFDQHRGPIAEAEAARREQEFEFERVQANAIGAIDAAIRAYEQALVEWSTAAEFERRVERTRAAAERALAAGDTDGLAALDARLEHARAARETWNALVHVQEAIGALTDALQTPLDGPAFSAPAPTLPEVQHP